ncbi:MAG: hypothetical protein EXS11_08375, partial [Gemmataceae bacterium]|nr:hypothetical protein [Gemmataceae bacterium]
MTYIQHRVNTLEELRSIPLEYGVEVDLRDNGSRLIMRHDPFGDGEDFEPFLAEFRNNGPLVLNIKSEGIEFRIIHLLERYKVMNYFFLDCSFPMIRKMISQGENQIAVRFSEFEPIESALALSDQVKWVWIDCFTKMPLTKQSYVQLKAKYKLCLVSPELQGQPIANIKSFNDLLEPYPMDAVCTKSP